MLKTVSLVKKASIWVLSAIQIIDIKIFNKSHSLIIESLALGRVVDLYIHLVPIEDAPERFNLVV